MKNKVAKDTWEAIKKFFHKCKHKVSAHAPEILTGLGVVGLGTTVVMVANEAPIARDALNAAEEKKGGPLTVKEKVAVAGRIYAPAAVSGALTTACIVGSNKISRDRHAALATAYAVSETVVRAYGDKVVEVLGEKEAERINGEVQNTVAKERVAAHPVKDNDIIVTGRGDELCYDVWSDRYFMSNYEELKEISHELIEDASANGFISVNDWYRAIDIKPIAGGDDYGFDMLSNPFGIRIDGDIAPDKRSCLAVIFKNEPKDVHGRTWYT